MTALDQLLLSAHEAQDTGTLVDLYQQAASQADNPVAAGFYLTHAYVFALEINHPDATMLRAQLVAQGRETPL